MAPESSAQMLKTSIRSERNPKAREFSIGKYLSVAVKEIKPVELEAICKIWGEIVINLKLLMVSSAELDQSGESFNELINLEIDKLYKAATRAVYIDKTQTLINFFAEQEKTKKPEDKNQALIDLIDRINISLFQLRGQIGTLARPRKEIIKTTTDSQPLKKVLKY